jgi:hypothetical protein
MMGEECVKPATAELAGAETHCKQHQPDLSLYSLPIASFQNMRWAILLDIANPSRKTSPNYVPERLHACLALQVGAS